MNFSFDSRFFFGEHLACYSALKVIMHVIEQYSKFKPGKGMTNLYHNKEYYFCFLFFFYIL